MRLLAKVLFCLCFLSVPALAQVQTNLDPDEPFFFPVIQFTNPPFGQCLGSPIPSNGAWCFALDPSNTTLPAGVFTGLFATKTEVNAVATAARADLNNLTNDLTRNTDLNNKKLFSLIAVSAALQDAIPNSGDRFAFKINTAGFRGNLAGAFGASMNFGRTARLSFNYGQAKRQYIFSGGLNFSIR